MFRKKLAFTAGGAATMQVFSDFEHVLTHTRVAGGTSILCDHVLFFLLTIFSEHFLIITLLSFLFFMYHHFPLNISFLQRFFPLNLSFTTILRFFIFILSHLLSFFLCSLLSTHCRIRRTTRMRAECSFPERHHATQSR